MSTRIRMMKVWMRLDDWCVLDYSRTELSLLPDTAGSKANIIGDNFQPGYMGFLNSAPWGFMLHAMITHQISQTNCNSIISDDPCEQWWSFNHLDSTVNFINMSLLVSSLSMHSLILHSVKKMEWHLYFNLPYYSFVYFLASPSLAKHKSITLIKRSVWEEMLYIYSCMWFSSLYSPHRDMYSEHVAVACM